MKHFMLGKKRFIAAALVASVLAGGSYAFANSFGGSVTSAALSSGNVTVSGCNDAVAVSYTVGAWDGVGFPVTYVTVKPDTSGSVHCVGPVSFELLNGTSGIGGGTGTISAPGASSGAMALTSGPAYSSAVTGIALVITG